MDLDMSVNVMPTELVANWQGVYGAYLSMVGSSEVERAEMARLSAGVAAVWRAMAARPGLAWWLVAALMTSAEAFEHQARDWSMPCGVLAPRAEEDKPQWPQPA